MADRKEPALHHPFMLCQQEVLRPLISIALELSKLKELTGRDAPTVIT